MPYDLTPDDFPEQARPIIAQLLDEPLRPPEDLRREIETHRKLLREGALSGSRVDAGVTERLATVCLALVWMVRDDASEALHRAVQLAVGYFVIDHDASSDFDGPEGLEDDREVIRVVCAHLGRGDLLEVSEETG